MTGVSREELIDEAVRRFADGVCGTSRISRATYLRLCIYALDGRDIRTVAGEFRRVCEERGVTHA